MRVTQQDSSSMAGSPVIYGRSSSLLSPPSPPSCVGPGPAVRLTMHHDEARVGRFSAFFATAATLFGVLGLISVAHASDARVGTAFAAPAFEAPSVRQGVMSERLRDCMTFERATGEGFVLVASSR
jgi:hypothetical protein